MKSYDGLNDTKGSHRIKVTLQNGSHKGSFIIEHFGNTKGKDVLNFDSTDLDEDDILSLEKDNCEIKLEQDTLFVTLTKPETGDTCEYELDDDEFMRMVIGIEIIDFQEE